MVPGCRLRALVDASSTFGSVLGRTEDNQTSLGTNHAINTGRREEVQRPPWLNQVYLSASRGAGKVSSRAVYRNAVR